MESRGIRRQGVLSKSKQAYPHFASDVGAANKFNNSAVAQFVAIVVIISTFLQGSEMDASVVLIVKQWTYNILVNVCNVLT